MSQQRNGPKKKEAAFSNNPFKSAIQVMKEQEKKEAQEKAAAEVVKRKVAAPPPRATKAPKVREEDDASLFFSAMDGVQQLTNRGEAPAPNPRLPAIIDENAEALAQLSELVAGQGDFDFTGTDECIEGAGPGIDRNLLRALRRGDFAIQGQLDLHGKTQNEARDALERFLGDSRRAKKRCVLVVHGRGLNSKDQIPVLKERLKGWLSEKRIGRMVLAFATARPQDGGTGAVYVLLRR
ncbi:MULTISPECIES: Smr/MutS family protein [Myxococcus]|uniref:Smr/MutS family protein n=1 Tax=Myxococcus TaxID=32 RepID=UPI00114306BB|nr:MULTISPECIES: Smr/MutS family protein [Myxococcus]NOK04382.1 DNA mismatch repair protein MutS [Myxococcus xanthus]